MDVRKRRGDKSTSPWGDQPTHFRSVQLELLRETYREVLDAVKHQDDKIGRLLAGLAFLTAATLAVGGLGSAAYLTRNFDIPPFKTPLALIALGSFIVCMVFAVTLLLAAFSTPLRLPGQFDQPKSSSMPVTWAHDIQGSPLFFFPISRLRIAEWSRKTTAASAVEAEQLLQERVETLVNETHNLASRAAYKHDRINEAVSLVAIALLSLLLAAVLTLIAAVSTPAGEEAAPPVHLTLGNSILLGALVALATFAQFHARIRDQRQTPDEALSADWKFPFYAAAVCCGLFCVIASSQGTLAWLIAAGDFALLAALIQVVIAYEARTRARVAAANARSAPGKLVHVIDEITARRQAWSAARAALGCVAVAAIALVLRGPDQYGLRLAIAAAGYITLASGSLVAPTFDARWRKVKQDLRDRQIAQEPPPRG